jgi:hypothetical protein
MHPALQELRDRHAAEENHMHHAHESFMNDCADALEYAHKWGITPTYYLQILPDLFVIAAYTAKVGAFVQACYRADVLHFEDMGVPVSYRGWITAGEAQHPRAKKISTQLMKQ